MDIVSLNRKYARTQINYFIFQLIKYVHHYDDVITNRRIAAWLLKVYAILCSALLR